MASKFMNLLRCVRLPNEPNESKRYVIPGQISAIDAAASSEYSTGIRYEVGAQLRSFMILPESEAVNVTVREYAAKNLQHQIADEVYGPIRTIINSMWYDIHELKRANALKDWHRVERIEKKLNEILEEITP